MIIESGAQSGVVTMDGRDGAMLLATYTYGDTGRDFTPTMTQAGTAINLTGATSITLTGVSPRASGDLTMSVTGTLLIAASGSLRFQAMGSQFPQPGSIRALDVYQCRISYTLSGSGYVSDPFMLACERFIS